MKDKEIISLIEKESMRQKNQINLIASENFVSKDILQAQTSILTNKYAEGYPHKRYYSGCKYIDEIENIAITRAKNLFEVKYVNVQPHSGSQANQAVFLALLEPGSTILGMSLHSGGHLTHGAKPNLSGKWFNSISYSVDKKTHLIDYDAVEKIAIQKKPKLIIAGYSGYTQKINFSKFKKISEKVGAYLLADISHISGIVATKHHESPVNFADVITSTTHKTLRGPRGGLIMTNNSDIYKKINHSIFPGIQGGPLMHIIAAKAVCFYEASQKSFSNYISRVLKNASLMCKIFIKRGFKVVSGKTQNHMMLIDLTDKNINGKKASDTLEEMGIIVNKNSIPFDKTPPAITSGIRIGSAACTTLGMNEEEFTIITNLISDILYDLSLKGKITKGQEYKDIVKKICSNFSYSQ